MRWFFSCLLLTLMGLVGAKSFVGDRLLVVLEDAAEREKYGVFLGDLEARGFHTTIETPKSDTLSLFKHGARAYDHVVLLPAKSKGLGPSLTANLILDFMKKDGNILVALSSEQGTPTAIASLLLELDIHIPADKNAQVVDHFNYDTTSAAEKHDVLLLPYPNALRPDVKNYFAGEGLIAVPRAVGQTLGNASPLLSPILRAPSTAYSYSPRDEADIVEDPFAVGAQLNIVSSHQALNSARLTVVGSAEVLQNAWFAEKVTTPSGKSVVCANRDFAEKVSAWTFKETGVLKVGRLAHYLADTNTSSRNPVLNPKIYRIKNDVAFEIALSEYSHDSLRPFHPAPGDVLQLEFSMLSPFHRLPLIPLRETANATIFGASFKTPDQHGIFNFRVNYQRPFLTTLDEKRQVTVRHFAHDEWPRSWEISGAWPWIAGIWVTVGGWVAFVGLWLWSAPVRSAVKKSQ